MRHAHTHTHTHTHTHIHTHDQSPPLLLLCPQMRPEDIQTRPKMSRTYQRNATNSSSKNCICKKNRVDLGATHTHTHTHTHTFSRPVATTATAPSVHETRKCTKETRKHTKETRTLARRTCNKCRDSIGRECSGSRAFIKKSQTRCWQPYKGFCQVRMCLCVRVRASSNRL